MSRKLTRSYIMSNERALINNPFTKAIYNAIIDIESFSIAAVSDDIVIEYFKFLDCLISSMPEPSNKNKIAVYNNEIKCLQGIRNQLYDKLKDIYKLDNIKPKI